MARPTAVAVCEMLRQTPLIAITAYVSALAAVVHELYNTATRSHPTIHAGMAVGWSAFKGSERARQLLTDLKATMPGDSKKRQGQTASVLRTAVYSTYSAAMLVVYERTLVVYDRRVQPRRWQCRRHELLPGGPGRRRMRNSASTVGRSIAQGIAEASGLSILR